MREIVKDKGRADARFRFWNWSDFFLFEALVLRILREREEKYSNNFAVWEMLFNFVVGKRE